MYWKLMLKILYLWLYLSVFQAISQPKKIEIVKFEHLQKLINHTSDTTLIVHFWATWCRPCVEELPSLENLSKEYSTKKIRFLMVSMDFPKDLQQKVIPFIAKNNIKSEVILLDEPDYNAWIDEVDKDWSGTIPATLLVNLTMRKRVFFEGQVNMEYFLEELKKMIPTAGAN